jgi:hypothetical protein
MKWRRVKNRNVIDRRGASPRGGGGMRLPIGAGGAGLGGVGLVGILIYLGIQVLSGGGGGAGGFDIGSAFGVNAQGEAAPGQEGIPPGQDPQRDLKDFSTYVFTDAQRSWQRTFAADDEPYEQAQLVLFSGGVDTACGSATSAVGPFYCPADSRVYLDLSFYEEMQRSLGGGGDFAWAYVIAHEMGHHVQNVTGTAAEVDRLSRADPDDANELSVRQELQADCYAGIWASTVFAAGDLEAGDIDEAFNAAEAVGDDRLQKRAGGTVNPDSFTHGTSEQRRTWFDRGYESGEPADCDTFAVDEL